MYSLILEVACLPDSLVARFLLMWAILLSQADLERITKSLQGCDAILQSGRRNDLQRGKYDSSSSSLAIAAATAWCKVYGYERENMGSEAIGIGRESPLHASDVVHDAGQKRLLT